MNGKEIQDRLNESLEKFKPGVKTLNGSEFLHDRMCQNNVVVLINIASWAAFTHDSVIKLVEQGRLDECVKARLLDALYDAISLANDDIKVLEGN